MSWPAIAGNKSGERSPRGFLYTKALRQDWSIQDRLILAIAGRKEMGCFGGVVGESGRSISARRICFSGRRAGIAISNAWHEPSFKQALSWAT